MTRSLALGAAFLALGAAPALAGWSSPKPIAPGHPAAFFSPQSISCPSATFCAAVTFGGLASTWNGSSWTAPVTIDPAGGVGGVSCGSTSFCVAVDNGGNEITYSGGTWHAPVRIDTINGLGMISCASSSFCVALDPEDVLVFDGSTWTAPTQLPTASFLTSVSCPSSSFCAVADASGEAFTFNGVAWTGPLVDGVADAAISCSSSSFCMAAGGDFAARFTGGSWGAGVNVLQDPLWNFDGVSCTSASFCVATAAFNSGFNDFVPGMAEKWNGTTWDVSAHNQYALTAVSCASSSFCLAVDTRGRYLKWFVGTRGSATAAKRLRSHARHRAGRRGRPRRRVASGGAPL